MRAADWTYAGHVSAAGRAGREAVRRASDAGDGPLLDSEVALGGGRCNGHGR